MSAVRAEVCRADRAPVAMSHACRAVRLLEMIRLLRERPHTSADLAERFDVSQRMIQYDLLILQGFPLYVPLWCDDDGRWRVLDGWRFL